MARRPHSRLRLTARRALYGTLALVVAGAAAAAAAEPPLVFATLEITNATGERLPRFEEYSEAALQELLKGIADVEVVFPSKVYETVVRDRVLVGELPGDAGKAADFARAVGARYLLTGAATRWQTGEESEELTVELVVVDEGARTYAFRKAFTATGKKEKTLGHRALLDELLRAAKEEVQALVRDLAAAAAAREHLRPLPFSAERVAALYRAAKRSLVPFSSGAARPVFDAAAQRPVEATRRTLSASYHLLSFDEGSDAGATLYRVELVWYLAGLRAQPEVRADAALWSAAIVRALAPGLAWDEATRGALGLDDLDRLDTASVVVDGLRITRVLVPAADPTDLVFVVDAPEDPAGAAPPRLEGAPAAAP